MKIVSGLLVGGLGNQLFQVAVSNLFINAGYNPKFYIIHEDLQGTHKEIYFNLLSNLFGVGKQDFTQLSYEDSLIFNAYLNNTDSYEAKFNFITSRNPWQTVKKRTALFSKIFLPKSISYAGYFQNWKNVYGQKDFLSKLDWALEKEVAKDQISSINPNFPVIHVRGSDFLLNKELYGILNYNFYREVLELVGTSKCYIVTDDEDYSKNMLKDFDDRLIYLKTSKNVFTDFYILSHAKKLVISNSTFSWWAGVIATRRGSQVYQPKPFHFGNLQSHNAFDYPGFQGVESRV